MTEAHVSNAIDDVLPIKNGIFFKFEDEVTSTGQFVQNTTEMGIILGAETLASSEIRVGVVTHIGPDCNSVNVGDRVLIEPLMWTLRFALDGVSHWKTDETKVVGILDD